MSEEYHCDRQSPASSSRSVSVIDRKAINERLLDLSIRTGFEIIQKNGQRYCVPPTQQGQFIVEPEKGSEIFIGRLPNDLFEDELVPFCADVGRIHSVRMMLQFSGFNRGYAFVRYFDAATAWRAISMLRNKEIRPGTILGITKSFDNCRLYVGGIPETISRTEIIEEMQKLFRSVTNIIMYKNPEDHSKNRGFCFVEFENHRSAAMAKRGCGNSTKLWDTELMLDWADPEPDVHPDTMASVCKLFLRNIPLRVDNEMIKNILCEVIPAYSIKRIYMATHYAFLHFDTRPRAEKAKEKLTNIVIDGEEIEVQWARPQICKNMRPSPRYRSVPPQHRQFAIENNNVAAAPMGNYNCINSPPLKPPCHVAPIMQYYNTPYIPPFYYYNY